MASCPYCAGPLTPEPDTAHETCGWCKRTVSKASLLHAHRRARHDAERAQIQAAQQ